MVVREAGGVPTRQRQLDVKGEKENKERYTKYIQKRKHNIFGGTKSYLKLIYPGPHSLKPAQSTFRVHIDQVQPWFDESEMKRGNSPKYYSFRKGRWD